MSILDIVQSAPTSARANAAMDALLRARDVRRRRLERLAEILNLTTTPMRLFETMECYPKRQRLALKLPDSPLAVAYRDPDIRREGLRGDTIADGIAFFGLTMREAHALLCDCGYGASQPGVALNAAIASRAKRLARRKSIRETMARAMTRMLALQERAKP